MFGTKLFLVALTLTSVSGFGQKMIEKKIPSAVKNTFQKTYPQVKKVNWEKEDDLYEAEFENNEIETSVVFNALGNIIETESEISIEDLPNLAKEYVKKKYPESKIKEATKIIDDKGNVTYEAEVKGKDLIFDSRGNFIKIN